MNFNSRILSTGLAFIVLTFGQLSGQPSSAADNSRLPDSLSLDFIIERVVASYPTVKAAEEAINAADARIGLARTGYNPEVDLTASYSNIGPVIKLSIPDMGTFKLYPDNNYAAGVNIRQTVYDFGRTKKNIAFETENRAISEQTLEQVKQRLAVMAVTNFYTLAYLQASINIKQQELDALNEHLSYVEKKKATGSSTEYEVLTTRVRISAVESQEVDLNSALGNQQAVLRSLLGLDQGQFPVVKTELGADIPVMPADSVLAFAYRNRDEILINKKRIAAAGLKYDLVSLTNRPMLNLSATGGAKNGYIPDLNKIKPNYSVGFGLRVPIYDGSRTRYNLIQAKSAMTSIEWETETAKRTISNEISEAESYMAAAQKKVHQYELQLEQAKKALALAETSFMSGTITNLDLLDSNTAVSESRLLLLKARIDFAASVYRLKAAMGARLY